MKENPPVFKKTTPPIERQSNIEKKKERKQFQ
jgi:hypothetical protein